MSAVTSAESSTRTVAPVHPHPLPALGRGDDTSEDSLHQHSILLVLASEQGQGAGTLAHPG